MKHTKHSKSRKGDLAEYYAVTWLWDNGYEVFLNAGCSGPIDMIAIKEGAVTLIDVKTSYFKSRNKRNKTGNSAYSPGGRTEEQKEMGVNFLGFDPNTRELRFVEHKDEQPD